VYGSQTYAPRSSGLVIGGGKKKYTRRALRKYKSKLSADFPNLLLSDGANLKREVPDYEEGRSYSPRELILLAEKILLQDDSPGPEWLNASKYLERMRHEIFTGLGTPDPAYGSGLYWRVHPNGRKYYSRQEMKEKGVGFYH
jgi:hypothetical protein